MGRVAVITDSTACLPKEVVAQHGIVVVPVELVIEGRVYRDGVDDVADFYAVLRHSSRLPTTSPSSPGTYLEAYRRASQQADEVLCITVSSSVSGMYDSARAAMELAGQALPGARIQVLDSQTAAMAQGFVVLEAARNAETGLEAAMAAARQAMSQVTLVCFLDTLYYLARSGRVPKAAAWAASLLQIKPIIRFRQGSIELVSRSRTRSRAMVRLLELVRREVGDRPVSLAVMHADARPEAEELRRRAQSTLQCVETYLTEFTPVMGSHTGPGLLGLAYHLRGEATGVSVK
ncbi:MAG: DegV family protein [Chloroflexi bacterium]|nr:DegV family protein [Chloroflexota bacterium]